jgi:hypothetical protein
MFVYYCESIQERDLNIYSTDTRNVTFLSLHRLTIYAMMPYLADAGYGGCAIPLISHTCSPSRDRNLEIRATMWLAHVTGGAKGVLIGLSDGTGHGGLFPGSWGDVMGGCAKVDHPTSTCQVDG